MFVKVKRLADGPGPSETVIGIQTSDGRQEEVVLSSKLVDSDMVDLGKPLLREDDNVLVELPRESASGRWRIWIPVSAMALT